MSIAVPVTQPKGGQFVLHAKALHGNPFDGHTLKGAIADVESNTGVEVRRIHVDKGYRGHDYPNRFRVFISGQVRRSTAAIKREMKRRAAGEPVIGHLKADVRMDRNYVKGQDGDRSNAILAAAGLNFHPLLRWLAALVRAIFLAALQSVVSPQPLDASSPEELHGRRYSGRLAVGSSTVCRPTAIIMRTGRATWL